MNSYISLGGLEDSSLLHQPPSDPRYSCLYELPCSSTPSIFIPFVHAKVEQIEALTKIWIDRSTISFPCKFSPKCSSDLRHSTRSAWFIKKDFDTIIAAFPSFDLTLDISTPSSTFVPIVTASTTATIALSATATAPASIATPNSSKSLSPKNEKQIQHLYECFSRLPVYVSPIDGVEYTMIFSDIPPCADVDIYTLPGHSNIFPRANVSIRPFTHSHDSQANISCGHLLSNGNSLYGSFANIIWNSFHMTSSPHLEYPQVIDFSSDPAAVEMTSHLDSSYSSYFTPFSIIYVDTTSLSSVQSFYSYLMIYIQGLNWGLRLFHHMSCLVVICQNTHLLDRHQHLDIPQVQETLEIIGIKILFHEERITRDYSEVCVESESDKIYSDMLVLPPLSNPDNANDEDTEQEQTFYDAKLFHVQQLRQSIYMSYDKSVLSRLPTVDIDSTLFTKAANGEDIIIDDEDIIFNTHRLIKFLDEVLVQSLFELHFGHKLYNHRSPTFLRVINPQIHSNSIHLGLPHPPRWYSSTRFIQHIFPHLPFNIPLKLLERYNTVQHHFEIPIIYFNGPFLPILGADEIAPNIHQHSFLDYLHRQYRTFEYFLSIIPFDPNNDTSKTEKLHNNPLTCCTLQPILPYYSLNSTQMSTPSTLLNENNDIGHYLVTKLVDIDQSQQTDNSIIKSSHFQHLGTKEYSTVLYPSIASVLEKAKNGSENESGNYDMSPYAINSFIMQRALPPQQPPQLFQQPGQSQPQQLQQTTSVTDNAQLLFTLTSNPIDFQTDDLYTNHLILYASSIDELNSGGNSVFQTRGRYIQPTLPIDHILQHQFDLISSPRHSTPILLPSSQFYNDRITSQFSPTQTSATSTTSTTSTTITSAPLTNSITTHQLIIHQTLMDFRFFFNLPLNHYSNANLPCSTYELDFNLCPAKYLGFTFVFNLNDSKMPGYFASLLRFYQFWPATKPLFVVFFHPYRNSSVHHELPSLILELLAKVHPSPPDGTSQHKLHIYPFHIKFSSDSEQSNEWTLISHQIQQISIVHYFYNYFLNSKQ